ncbi:MAG TPA: AI-2E family transporter [Acidimicrobiales bacterium]|nr:AI-2E family transporter [Acidimicrobiales bacterium]
MTTERIRRAGQVSWALVGLSLLVAVVGFVAWELRVIWPPLILAGAIVFVLHPVVTGLHRRGIPRVAGTALTYLGILVLLVIVGLAVFPLASDQAEELRDEWPDIREDVEETIDEWAEKSEDWIVSVPSVAEIEDEVDGTGEETIGDRIEQVRDVGSRVFHVALIVFLAPVLAFYLLVDLPRLRVVAESLLPPGNRDELLHVGRRLNRAIGGFFRGQLLVALIVGVIVSVCLAVVGLPFWLIVGMIAGLFNVIPLIGPWVGAVPGIIIALTTRDVATAVWVAAIMAGAQQLDNHFISPVVMQRAVKLHPAAVLLALLAGGTLGGFFGLLLAVPTTAVLKILGGHLWRTYVLGEPYEVAIAVEEVDEGAEPGLVREVV